MHWQTIDVGNGAPAADTTCKATICVINEMVVKNKCESCPAGKTNVAGDDACMADNQGTIDRVCNQCVDGDTDNVLCSKQAKAEGRWMQAAVTSKRGGDGGGGNLAPGGNPGGRGALPPNGARAGAGGNPAMPKLTDEATNQ